MGRDKALLSDGRGSLIERALATLDEVCAEVLFACGNEPRYEGFGRKVVLDVVEGAGPLAGLAAGLSEARHEWVVALACDMPDVRADHLRALLARARAEELDACLVARGERVEPLCAVYRRTCLEPVLGALNTGGRKMVSFWTPQAGAGLKVGRLAVDAFESEGTLDPCFNVNTPEDWAVFTGESRGGADV